MMWNSLTTARWAAALVLFAATLGNLAADNPCSPNPCINSGKCFQKAQESVPYTCACRTGWHGTNCETAYPVCAEDNDYCWNGGQCYDHGENGLRCKCAEGFLGKQCELNELQCFNEKSVRNGGAMTPETTDCTKDVIRIEKKRNEPQQISACKAQMRDQYKTGRLYVDDVDGPSLLLEARSYSECESGDWRSFVKNRFCCPTCFSLPCQNNGWCTQEDNGDYVCTCQEGWYGKNCELEHQCPEGQYFNKSATACPATCSNPTAPESCTEPEREGCVCPEGLFLLDGACVEHSQCSCEGGTRQIGEQWSKNYTCETQYKCEAGEVKEFSDCVEMEEKPTPSDPCVVSDCDLTTYLDSEEIVVDFTELPVIVGKEYILAANTPEKSLIVLSKMGSGDVVETVACEAATQCEMKVVVTREEAVFNSTFVKVVVSQDLTETHTMCRMVYPLPIIGDNGDVFGDDLVDDLDC